MTVITTISNGFAKYKIEFLKIPYLSEFLIMTFGLFRSLMVGGMKKTLKKSCFILERGRLATVLVVYEKFVTGINLER